MRHVQIRLGYVKKSRAGTRPIAQCKRQASSKFAASRFVHRQGTDTCVAFKARMCWNCQLFSECSALRSLLMRA